MDELPIPDPDESILSGLKRYKDDLKQADIINQAVRLMYGHFHDDLHNICQRMIQQTGPDKHGIRIIWLGPTKWKMSLHESVPYGEVHEFPYYDRGF